jgi:hypothetical protein
LRCPYCHSIFDAHDSDDFHEHLVACANDSLHTSPQSPHAQFRFNFELDDESTLSTIDESDDDDWCPPDLDEDDPEFYRVPYDQSHPHHLPPNELMVSCDEQRRIITEFNALSLANHICSRTPEQTDKEIYPACNAPEFLRHNQALRQVVFSNLIQTWDYDTLNEEDANSFSSVENIALEPTDFTCLQSSTSLIPSLNEFDREWILSLSEDLILLISGILNSKNKAGQITSICAFAKSRNCGASIILSIQTHLLDKFEQLLSFTDFEDTQSIETLTQYSRDFLTNFEIFRESPLFKKIYKFSMYALSFCLFQKIGLNFDTLQYTVVEQAALRRKFNNFPSFIMTCLDLVTFLCEKGIQIYKTGDINCIFHSSSTYEKFFNDAKLLEMQSKYLSNPEALDFTEHDFFDRLDSTIEVGLNISKYAKDIGRAQHAMVNQILSSLQMIRSDCLTFAKAAEMRKTPLGILTFGDSGIGKSSFLEILYCYYAKIAGLPNDDKFRYTRNGAAKYWDNFKTYMWCIVFDDVSCYHPAKVQGIDPTIEEMIQVINPTPFVPDQAALEAKGKTPVRAQLVLGSTNVKSLNANMYYAHAPAVQRRMPWVITLKVKKEFAMEDGRLDSAKVPSSAIGYPDLWSITVEEVKTLPVQRGISNNAPYMPVEFEGEVLKDVDMSIFLKWYRTIILRHSANQETMTKAVEEIRESSLCECCSLPTNLCYKIQSSSLLESVQQGSYLLCCWLLISYLVLHIGFIVSKLCTFHVFWKQLNFMLAKFNEFKSWFSYDARNWKPTRENFKRLGHSIQTKIGHPYVFLAIGVFVTLSATIYKLSSRVMNIQGNNFSKPKKHEKERENVWYNYGEFTNFSIPDHSKCSTSEDVVNLILKNTFKIFSQGPDVPDGELEGVGGHMLGLRGHIFISNNHTIPEGDFRIRVTQKAKFNTTGISSDRKFLVTQDQITRYPEHDLAILRLPQLPPVKDITKYIGDVSLDARAPASIVNTKMVRQLGMISRCSRSTLPLSGYDNTPLWYGHSDVPTTEGDCGSPYVHLSPMGAQVVGLHVAGQQGAVAAVPLRKDIIMQHIATELVEAGSPNIQSDSVPRSLRSLDVKSPIRFIEENGSLDVYGSFVGFRNQPKTMVDISPIAHLLQNHGFEITHTKPVMKGYIPKRTTLLELIHPPENFRHDILEKVKKSFLNEILTMLPKDQVDELQPYDVFTAINGAEGVSYVDSINRSTSAGNPWKCSKKNFLEKLPPQHGLLDPVKFNAEITERIHEFVQIYSLGKRNMPNFCAHLKDEPVSFKKAAIGKTRVFAGAPVDFSVVTRQYYLPLVRLLQNNRFAFESGPGTISQSSEWGDFYRYLTKYGEDRMIAGDFKMFDKKMPSNLMLNAFWILIQIAKRGKYTDEDEKVMTGIAEDTSFALVDYFGDLIQTHSFNPSGHPLTVIINGLVNAMYMRYAYYMNNPDNECDTFKKNVALMTYGDDNIMGVSPYTPWFNHTSIAKCLSEAGITYTMADKEAESVPYIHIDQCNFLKRSWRFEPALGDYAAPLELESIQKSLMVWTYSKTVTPAEQGVAVISSALREYFFHGKETFDRMTRLLNSIVDEVGWREYVTDATFPTWNELVRSWHDASQKVRA